MKRKDYNRLNSSEKKAISELAKDNPASLLVRSKEGRKSIYDTPLFSKENSQTNLF